MARKYICFLCNQDAKKHEFCFGCRVFICGDCDKPEAELCDVGHSPAEHLKCKSCRRGEAPVNPPYWATNRPRLDNQGTKPDWPRLASQVGIALGTSPGECSCGCRSYRMKTSETHVSAWVDPEHETE